MAVVKEGTSVLSKTLEGGGPLGFPEEGWRRGPASSTPSRPRSAVCQSALPSPCLPIMPCFIAIAALAVGCLPLTASQMMPPSSPPPPGTLVVVPPAGAGIFADVQFLNPHAYGPNEIATQNWVYEGLVSYGVDGAILPALAASWDIIPSNVALGGVDIVFQLRQGVTFHDGAPWNAAACKMNFDNVFSPALAATYHSWYALPTMAVSWSVSGPFTFVLTLSAPYNPALQELSIIRPLRFLSPASFFTDAPGDNSCPANRGNVTARGTWALCRGIKSPMGTGPYKFVSKATTLGRVMTPANVSFTALNPGELVTGVEWAANTRWWGAASLPQPPVGRVLTPTNLNSSAVRAGLLAGTIHAAVGAATLSPTDFAALRASSGTPGAPTALISMPLQTRVLLLNSNASAPAAMGATGLPLPGPLASLAVRRAVNKALDKVALVAALGGLEAAADRLFSTDTPFSNTSIGALPVFDAAGARTLLEQDGWVVPTGATFRARAGVQLAGELTYVANDASAAAIVPVIAANLFAIGYNLTATALSKTAFQNRNFAGQFDLTITETLGDPYDPFSFVASWRVPRSYEYFALAGMGAGSGVSKAQLDGLITESLAVLGDTFLQQLYTQILTAVNSDAVFAPLTYMTTRAVVRPEVSRFAFGQQQLPSAGTTSASSSDLSPGAISGIAVGAVLGISLIVGSALVIRRCCCPASGGGNGKVPSVPTPPINWPPA